MFKTHLFGARTILSSDVEISRFILHSDANTFVPDYPSSLMELMGKSSILVCNGDLQRRVHGLVGYFLKSGQLRDQVTSDLVRRMDGSMKDWKDGEVVHIQDQAKSVNYLSLSLFYFKAWYVAVAYSKTARSCIKKVGLKYAHVLIFVPELKN